MTNNKLAQKLKQWFCKIEAGSSLMGENKQEFFEIVAEVKALEEKSAEEKR